MIKNYMVFQFREMPCSCGSVHKTMIQDYHTKAFTQKEAIAKFENETPIEVCPSDVVEVWERRGVGIATHSTIDFHSPVESEVESCLPSKARLQ